MSKIAISVETAADFSPELLKEFAIPTIPFTIVMGEKEAKDGEVRSEDLFAFVEKTGTLPHTSAVNVGEFDSFFKELLKDNDEIVHISLSSGISCAYQNAVTASSSFEGKVHVIDSHVLSTGIALLALYAVRLRNAGYSASEIVKAVERRIPNDQTSFGLENVEYLYKGGRCSALARLGVNLLKIKPQIIMDPMTGKMKSAKKFRGNTEKWVLDYVDATLEENDNPDLERVFITYSSMEDEIVEKVAERLKQRGFRNVSPTRAGATISTHCGPHCLGILYLNDGEHPVTKK